MSLDPSWRRWVPLSGAGLLILGAGTFWVVTADPPKPSGGQVADAAVVRKQHAPPPAVGLERRKLDTGRKATTIDKPNRPVRDRPNRMSPSRKAPKRGGKRVLKKTWSRGS